MHISIYIQQYKYSFPSLTPVNPLLSTDDFILDVMQTKAPSTLFPFSAEVSTKGILSSFALSLPSSKDTWRLNSEIGYEDVCTSVYY